LSKARIYRGRNDSRTIAELESLLAEIGCEKLNDVPEEMVEPTPDAEEDDANADPEAAPAFLVILNEDCVGDPDVDPAIMAAVARGERVIGVWRQGGGSGTGMPKTFADVACDTVVWDPACIGPSIEGVPQHQAPDGSPAKRPKTPTNPC
jgi:hypothetical protein